MRSVAKVVSLFLIIVALLFATACDSCKEKPPQKDQAEPDRPTVSVSRAAISGFAEQLTRTPFPLGLNREQVLQKLGEPGGEQQLDNGRTRLIYGQKPDLSPESMLQKGVRIIGASIDFEKDVAVVYEWMVLSTKPSPEAVKQKLASMVEASFGQGSYRHTVEKSEKAEDEIHVHRVDFRSETLHGFFEFSEMQKGVTSYRFEIKPIDE
jgi:hypothetical protein